LCRHWGQAPPLRLHATYRAWRAHATQGARALGAGAPLAAATLRSQRRAVDRGEQEQSKKPATQTDQNKSKKPATPSVK